MAKVNWPTQKKSDLKNKVLSKKRDIPFSTIKDEIPVPVYPDRPEFVELYWLAWELAWDHVMTNAGAPQSPYMDEAHSRDRIWYWDTCFMVCFCRYAPQHFPGIESLRNFYLPMLDDVPSTLAIHHPDNPPMFAWVEYEYSKLTGDMDHLRWLLVENKYLQRFFDFYEWIDAANPPKQPPGSSRYAARRMPSPELIEEEGFPNELWGYQWGNLQSGMDNTPRSRGNQEPMLWVDLLAQMTLAAESTIKLARILNSEEAKKIINEFTPKYESMKKLLNEYYWDEKDGIYYDLMMDLDNDGIPTSKVQPKKFCKVKTPAAYWAMLAGCCDEKQAASMADWADDHEHGFGAPRPWVTVPRDDPDFVPDGHYWRGGIWLPTGYMAQKALDRYGFHDLAKKNAIAILDLMYATYKNVETEENPDGDLEIATIWEAYSPTDDLPAAYKNRFMLSRPHFCGWSALGPISLFIEDILGFHTINAHENLVIWRITHDSKHGIKQLRFGDNVADIVYQGNKIININSKFPFTLEVNGKRFAIREGNQEISIKR